MLNRSRVAVTAMFNEARLGKAVDTERCLPIVDEVAGSVARNPAAFCRWRGSRTRTTTPTCTRSPCAR